MKLIQIAASLMTTATCFAPLVPAFAGPLDTYNGSILDPNSSILSSDPRLLCDDIVQKADTEHRRASGRDALYQSSSSDIWKTTDNESGTSSKKISGGASFLGIGGKGSYEDASSHNQATSDEGKRDRSSLNRNSSQDENYLKTSTPIAAGKSCSELTKAAASRDAAAFQADAQVQSVRIATEGKLKAIEIEANHKFLENLLKW